MMVGGARGRKDVGKEGGEEEEMEVGGAKKVPKGEDDSDEALQKAREWDEFKDGEECVNSLHLETFRGAWRAVDQCSLYDFHGKS